MYTICIYLVQQLYYIVESLNIINSQRRVHSEGKIITYRCCRGTNSFTAVPSTKHYSPCPLVILCDVVTYLPRTKIYLVCATYLI